MKRPDSAGWLDRRWAFVAVLALPVLLAGCFGKTSAETLTCPSGAVTPGLAVAPQFGPGPGRTRNDITAAARMLAIKATCSEDKAGGIRIDVLVSFSIVRGSPQVQNSHFTYFIAVVNGASNILNEQRFVLPVRFPGNELFVATNDNITVHLPVKRVAAGADYGVVGGFQLTPEQIEFNNTQQQSPTQ
ncbi:MAG: hypothetical protein ACREEL_14500 [Stellaceae bacterium]